MRTNYVLIDYENVQVKSLSRLRAEHFRVQVFLGAKNTKLHRELVLAMHEFGARASYVELESSGPNALDFHLAFYLGQLSRVDPEGFYHIISKDTGFDPLVAHLKARKIYAARSVSIEDMPCFVPRVASVEDRADITPPTATVTEKTLALLFDLALNDLQKRKSARPRTEKTLRSTLRAKFPKDIDDSTVEAVIGLLRERKLVTMAGTKLIYALPEAALT